MSAAVFARSREPAFATHTNTICRHDERVAVGRRGRTGSTGFTVTFAGGDHHQVDRGDQGEYGEEDDNSVGCIEKDRRDDCDQADQESERRQDQPQSQRAAGRREAAEPQPGALGEACRPPVTEIFPSVLACALPTEGGTYELMFRALF